MAPQPPRTALACRAESRWISNPACVSLARWSSKVNCRGASLRKNINLYYRLVRRVRRNSSELLEIFGCSVPFGASAHALDGTKEAGEFGPAEELGDPVVLATQPSGETGRDNWDNPAAPVFDESGIHERAHVRGNHALPPGGYTGRRRWI